MADDNVKRVVIPPKRNVSPLLLAGLIHYVAIRVYLFFAPLITRVWRTYLQALRAVTLPYQCCCTIMMFAIFWPFIALVAWFYACFRLFEYYGWPLREVPIVGTLMGPLNVREPPVRRVAAAAAAAGAAAAGAPPGGVRHRPAAATQAAPAQAAPAAAPVAVRGPTAAAQAQPAGAEASGVKTEAAAASGDATASAPAAEEASTSTAASTSSAATSSAAAGATGGAAAGAEQGAKPKRSARDRSPDGWFGPPPPEEGGPEPPYVPYDPDFVDPTDYLPEEELAKYKFYKRRTPYRRVP